MGTSPASIPANLSVGYAFASISTSESQANVSVRYIMPVNTTDKFTQTLQAQSRSPPVDTEHRRRRESTPRRRESTPRRRESTDVYTPRRREYTHRRRSTDNDAD